MKRLFLISNYYEPGFINVLSAEKKEEWRKMCQGSARLYKRIKEDIENGDFSKINLKFTPRIIRLSHEDYPDNSLYSIEIGEYDIEHDLAELSEYLFDDEELDITDFSEDGYGYEIRIGAIHDPIRDDYNEYSYAHITNTVEAFGIDEVIERVHDNLLLSEMHIEKEIEDPMDSCNMWALIDFDLN